MMSNTLMEKVEIQQEYSIVRAKNNKGKISRELLIRSWKICLFLIAVAAHIILIFSVYIDVEEKKPKQDSSIFKMVDIQEFIPPEPEVEKKPEPVIKNLPLEPEKQIITVDQNAIAEKIIETEKEVIEIPRSQTAGVVIEYLPQHKISEPPQIPTRAIRENIKYPQLANKQGIEGVVFLELYIDQHGRIRNILVLKDPGYGLAEAAIAAFEGIVCQPAFAEEKAVAVRFRYPVRFQLK